MLRNLWHHFLLITRHRHKVIAHCKKAGILWQGLRHDLSKYSPTEFIPGGNIIRETAAPTKKNGKSSVILSHGYTTKVETAITLNTGRTTTPWKRKSCL